MMIPTPKDQIFLSNTLTNNGISFLLTIKFLIFYFIIIKMCPEVAEYAEMCQNDNVTLLPTKLHASHILINPQV